MGSIIKGKYLYVKVYETLREKIATGEYETNDLLPSEQKIGKVFEVDRATVRKALKLLVDDGVVEKMPGIGTKVILPSAAMRREPVQNGNSVAFFLPRSVTNENRISQPFYSNLFFNVEDRCRRHGYQVYYSTLDETDDISALFGNRNFAGVLFISNIHKPHIDYAVSRRIPSVLLNEYCENIPSVLENNFEGSYLSCRHLIDMGHRKIAVLRGIRDYTSSKERMKGFLYAMYEANIPVCGKYIMDSEWDAASGYREVGKLLHSLQTCQIPTAIAAFNDGSAFGAMQAISQFGLKIPDDVSITGFDNVDQSLYSVPSLTTIDTNIPMMADAAVENLLHQMSGAKAVNVKILTPVKLIVRDSVGRTK
ncbi:MAG: GntR family transcriptional regulator [Synergistaceae bacterium]|jgi:LacI family transcriptional regulator|nr:GntR family transcriptional regulator [Synergistaceae bacterium]